jgi:putative DNA primase/helicase
MEVYDRDRLSGLLFGSLEKTSPAPAENADSEVSDQPAGQGDASNTNNDSGNADLNVDAASIDIRSVKNLVVYPQSSNASTDTMSSMPDDIVGIIDSSQVEVVSGEQPETDDETIARLAALAPFEYDRIRLEEAKRLGVQPKTLDAEVKAARSGDSDTGNASPFVDIEPYPQAVDPGELFNDISKGARRFLIISEHQADAMTLWVAHTYMFDLFEVSPLLLFNAPERACAKTLAQTIVSKLCYRPLPAANASMSALFRSVEWKPTILLDEVDTYLGRNPEAQGLVNAGYKVGGFVLRSEPTGDSFTPKIFPVFCPKSIAGIALERHLPDSTMSRCIPINMRRKLPGESVERLRHADKGLFDTLKSKLARVALDNAKQIRQARPELPEKLSDRAQDNWEPLLAIACCAGQEWLERATRAAIELSGKADDAGSVSNELLADIREVFAKKKVGKICSADLISALTTQGDYGWGSYNRGKPLTTRQLAKQLGAYGIKPKNLRFQSATLKGYERADFAEIFERYLAPPENPPQRSVSQNALPAEDLDAADSGAVIRNAADDAQQDDDLTDTDKLIAAFEVEFVATPNSSPAVDRGGAADAAADGEDGDDDEAF